MADSPTAPQPRSRPLPIHHRAAYGFIFVLAIVLILVLVILAPTSGLTPATKKTALGANVPVTITSVKIDFTGAPNCWTSVSASGGKITGGQQFTVQAVLSYGAKSPKQSSCTITSLSIATTSFSLVKANVPLTIPSGGARTLSITVTVPTRAYSGVLTIDAKATAASRAHL